MIEKEVQELLSFIDGNPTAYHTTASVRNILLKEGFSELLESRRWQLEPGRSYFVCRNGSSILAFRMGEQLENYSFNVAAAHTDSPCFRIKENAEIHMGRKYTKLNTEGYGGMICSTWMDRPLSVAGRVLIKENNAITSRLLTLDGVGKKVANCVCLFGYGRTAMAPIDVWIHRLIDEEFGGRDPFPAYGQQAGIVQQYLFYYKRSISTQKK